LSASVTIRHNFETGHRLPHLSGKCENLHGHSWWVEVTVATEVDTDVVVEFGAFKKALREWIDTHLDHGLMLSVNDPLSQLLPGYGKVFKFGEDVPGNYLTRDLGWPTVENVAHMLGRVAVHALLQQSRAQGASVTEVKVSETHVNAATWKPAE